VRRRARATAVALLAAAAVLAAGSDALGAGATGDPATIRYVRAVAATTNGQPAMLLSQTGYMAESATPGGPGSFSYRWGFGTLPPGWVHASEAITVAQHLGRVVWLTDVLTAAKPGCTATSGCPQLTPIELFVTKAAAFAGLVDGPSQTVGCYVRERMANVPYRAGGRWWTPVGDFRPMVVRGNQVLVTVTYAWSDGQHVVERDSIEASTRLFTASSFHVGPGTTKAATAFSFAQNDAVLSYTPPAPKVTVCR
jgi:hypothetical protein